MSTFYSNLPQPKVTDSALQTQKVFDAYTTAPINVDAATLDAMSGFFESRGFGQDSAQSMAYVILKQAILDKYQPLQLLDTLSGLSNVELNGLITQILNFNRYKTSSLGTASPFAPRSEVARNIVA